MFLAKIPAPPLRPSSRVRRIALAAFPAKDLVAVGRSIHVADQVAHYTRKENSVWVWKVYDVLSDESDQKTRRLLNSILQHPVG